MAAGSFDEWRRSLRDVKGYFEAESLFAEMRKVNRAMQQTEAAILTLETELQTVDMEPYQAKELTRKMNGLRAEQATRNFIIRNLSERKNAFVRDYRDAWRYATADEPTLRALHAKDEAEDLAAKDRIRAFMDDSEWEEFPLDDDSRYYRKREKELLQERDRELLQKPGSGRGSPNDSLTYAYEAGPPYFPTLPARNAKRQASSSPLVIDSSPDPSPLARNAISRASSSPLVIDSSPESAGATRGPLARGKPPVYDLDAEYYRSREAMGKKPARDIDAVPLGGRNQGKSSRQPQRKKPKDYVPLRARDTMDRMGPDLSDMMGRMGPDLRDTMGRMGPDLSDMMGRISPDLRDMMGRMGPGASDRAGAAYDMDADGARAESAPSPARDEAARAAPARRRTGNNYTEEQVIGEILRWIDGGEQRALSEELNAMYVGMYRAGGGLALDFFGCAMAHVLANAPELALLDVDVLMDDMQDLAMNLSEAMGLKKPIVTRATLTAGERFTLMTNRLYKGALLLLRGLYGSDTQRIKQTLIYLLDNKVQDMHNQGSSRRIRHFLSSETA